MAVTLTSRFGLPQWSAGADTPSRTAFTDAFAKLDAAARDAGAQGGASLPTTGVTDGLYAQTVSGVHRRMFRRAGGAWQQIGGTSWGETTYHQAESGVATDSLARQIGHASLTTPPVREYWDGSSIRGGRQAIGDVNSGGPGALHVGDTDSAVDLAVRGRVFGRTRAAGQRAFVAQSGGADHGPMFTARESGGTEPWLIDAVGRMRAQAPSAFGAAALDAAAALSSAPGTDQTSAAALYAAASKSALRILRAAGDATPIAQFDQDRITLGRSGWSSARIDLISPDNRVTGPLTVSGAVSLAGSLAAGAASVSSLAASGPVSGSSVTASGGLSAEGGLVQSSAGSGGATVLTRPPVQYQSNTALASLRQSHVGYSQRAANLSIPGSSAPARYDMPIYMPEAGWMRLDTILRVRAELGLSNSFETLRFNVTFTLIDANGSVIEDGYTHVNTVTTDDTSRQIDGYCGFTITDLFWTRVPAGNYTIRMTYVRGSVLGGTIERIRYIATPVVLANVNSG